MSNKVRFDGRVVIVTGAGAGLGRAYALLFASRGASVVVNDLGGGRHGDGSSTKAADVVVDEIRRNGGKAVANYDSVVDGEKVVKSAIDAFGRVDIVINNAGILRDKSFMRMSDTDWDLVHSVHLKAAAKITQAAWPYFRKQSYGRVIMTSSHSGIYGNFGQANYSSAKMGLIGLANTLALEGEKYNIHTNVIVPTAASRLTEDILPPDLFTALKPELIAPVVAWLCHEDCSDNGSIIDAAAGWSGKTQVIRSSGCILRKNLNEMVTPENARDNWETVTDMSQAKHLNSIGEATGELINALDEMREGKSGGPIHRCHYDKRDIILYALGVGATTQESSDMCYLYENHENFSVLPTFFVVFGTSGSTIPIFENALPEGVQLDPSRILHGEQYLEVFKRIPTEGKIESRFRLQDVLDKGKGAVVLIEQETYDMESGEKLAKLQMSVFIVGAGGFNGPRNSSHIIPTLEHPKRKPDMSVQQKTNVDQAALYRLCGDYNPLHIDPMIASLGGYSQPILHGLCSLGFSTRHVLHTYAGGDSDLFKAIKVRFSKPVLPGQTLRTDMWQEGNRIHFETTVVETETPVITGAYIDLKQVQQPTVMKNLCSGKINLESDGVFEQINDYVKSHTEEVKKINGIFYYVVTSKGEPTAHWTIDLKKGEVYRGEPKTKADTTLTIDDKDMIQMALGKLNPQVAFMQGKLKIKGNIMLTQKLKTLLDANRPKL
ncbi:peroxisomal multifunctional enzyme type 2 [Leptopilina boulardi]|uniref:peroxisomal multifunctional enzyme type 2 n=1 Tax=Leptopilina boulardi TaxID=63433 RepID=UPI0021F527FB|nr:peroxisomal multifunctional enzyme type 2 [Leptopilina boulardi]XP_051155368.1 peroxisomal multifunctional enzyme type 2 [Leptopilina boulardi]